MLIQGFLFYGNKSFQDLNMMKWQNIYVPRFDIPTANKQFEYGFSVHIIHMDAKFFNVSNLFHSRAKYKMPPPELPQPLRSSRAEHPPPLSNNLSDNILNSLYIDRYLKLHMIILYEVFLSERYDTTLVLVTDV